MISSSYKYVKIFLTTVVLVMVAGSATADLLSTPPAKKKKKLSPYQAQIEKCFQGQINSAGLYDNKQLYQEIVKNYPLQASETLFREVIYKLNGVGRKLRLEDGVVKLFKVESDESLSLVESHNFNEDKKADSMRYKVLSREARLNELLNRAEISEDFIKTVEYRSRQLILNLSWSNSQIKLLNVQLQSPNAKLECRQKDKADICDCRLENN